ncbi:MAG TPA: membrane protein insertase YidC, partial [Bacteroidales bacterium]|nr:membrane protein insertase YidC [Bacteroidales bacterium]
MDKNTITGLILIFAIFIGSSIYSNSRVKKAYNQAVQTADENYTKGNFESARTGYYEALRLKPNQPEIVAKLNEVNEKLGISEKTDSTSVNTGAPAVAQKSIAIPDSGQLGVFSAAMHGENDFITLENNKVELKISLKGGRVYSARLKDFKTFDGRPLVLFSGDSTIFGFNFFTVDNKAVQTNNLYFTPVNTSKTVSVTSKAEKVILRLVVGDGKYIEYMYTLAPDKYMLDFDVTFKSMDGIIAPNQNSLALDWRMYLPQQEKGRSNEETYVNVRYKHFQENVEDLATRQRKELVEINVPTKLSWVAFQDQFFSSV